MADHLKVGLLQTQIWWELVAARQRFVTLEQQS